MGTRTDDIDIRSWPKKERQAYAREIAAIKREELRMRKRRNKITLVLSLSLAGVTVLALAALALYGQYREMLAGPANMGSDGLILTSDGTTVSAVSSARIEPDGTPDATTVADYSDATYMALYLDYSSADSAAFINANAAQIEEWLTAGYVTLEVHPVATAGNTYSERAANAVACVADADPDSFLTVSDALFAAYSADGLSNDEILATVSAAGITDTDVLDCVSGDRFAHWVTTASARAHDSIPNADVGSAASVPVVVVDQTTYTGAFDDADAFYTFITEMYADDTTDDVTTEESGE
jgi:hypothetical protein